MNILEELWYGNICPSEKPIRKNSEYANTLHKVVEVKERLQPKVPPELQPDLEELMDVQMEAAVVAERDAFQLGFRLAVQIMVDSLRVPL